jgi:hypothetical protein
MSSKTRPTLGTAGLFHPTTPSPDGPRPLCQQTDQARDYRPIVASALTFGARNSPGIEHFGSLGGVKLIAK